MIARDRTGGPRPDGRGAHCGGPITVTPSADCPWDRDRGRRSARPGPPAEPPPAADLRLV